jgi:hypothetical protein
LFCFSVTIKHEVFGPVFFKHIYYANQTVSKGLFCVFGGGELVNKKASRGELKKFERGNYNGLGLL